MTKLALGKINNMHYKLKGLIEESLEKIINDNCEDDFWNGVIHPEIYNQMTNAVESVFDSAMKSQDFVRNET
ncbi:MAG: hypothetical protein AABY22_06525 [Nanoarchaeota archaeon]